MKKWLAVSAMLVVACHADIAAAETRTPSLWQRVLAVFNTHPTHHAVATTHEHESVQKAQAAPATPPPANAAVAETVVVKTPARRDETVPVVRAAAPVAPAAVKPVAVATVAAVPVAFAPVAAARVAATPAPVAPPPVVSAVEPVPVAAPASQFELASSVTRPAKPPKKSHRDAAKAAPVAAAEQPGDRMTPDIFTSTQDAPYDVAPLAKPHEVAKVSKKSGRAKLDHAADVAVLGSPNLRNALPPEAAPGATAPVPSERPRLPAGQEQGAGCNSGQRIITAYYWEGHHTASGQPFDPHGMTAAHRTLPFGTRLNVTNPRTGKSVSVVVNDRGPYTRGVSLDLSLGAAQAIGLKGTGSVCVL